MEQQIRAVAVLDEPVRRALYAYVASSPDEVTRDAAARAAGISRALAAFHLDKLAAEGFLAVSYRRLSGRRGRGAGRPAKLYRPSGRQLDVTVPPRRYELAARLFVRTFAQHADPAARAALRRAARRLGAEIGAAARPTTGRRPLRARQVRQAEELLRDYGYEPVRCDRDIVRLRNCPFHALAQDQRALVCGMNLALIEGVVDGLGLRSVHAAADPQPGFCCVALQRSPESQSARSRRSGPS
jgi:predicted ArsR family transcriptional regulator